MRQKQKVYQIFSFCILISFIFIIFSPSRPVRFLSGVLEKTLSPLQTSVYSNLGLILKDDNEELEKLKTENLELNIKLVKIKKLERDLQVLESQLSESTPNPKKLIITNIIGSDISYPGSNPSEVIIDKGESHGITSGKAVVYKNNLIGIIHKTVNNRAVVKLVNNNDISFTAETLQTGALGIIKGGENSIRFTNAVLSDTLTREDLVITKGDLRLDGKGLPPGLIVGRINSIDKKPSALFQSASVTPLVDIAKLSVIFVVID